MKVIVTGSRDWEDILAVYMALNRAYAGSHPEPMEVAVGDCPNGVDLFTKMWCEEFPGIISFKIYEADWYGPCDPDCYHRPRKPGQKCVAKGPKRNKRMIDENLDADYVLGFPLGESRGTRGCMEYAESLGLRVINLGEK